MDTKEEQVEFRKANDLEDPESTIPLEALNPYLQVVGEYVEFGTSPSSIQETKWDQDNLEHSFLQIFFDDPSKQSPPDIIKNKLEETPFWADTPNTKSSDSQKSQRNIEDVYPYLLLMNSKMKAHSNPNHLVLLIALAEMNDPYWKSKIPSWLLGKLKQAYGSHIVEHQFILFLQQISTDTIFYQAQLPEIEKSYFTWPGIQDLSSHTMPLFFKQWIQSRYISEFIQLVYEKPLCVKFHLYALMLHTGVSHGYFPSFFGYAPGEQFSSSNALFTKLHQLHQYIDRYTEMYQFRSNEEDKIPFWNLFHITQLRTMILQLRIFNEHSITDLSEENLNHLKRYIQFLIRNYQSDPRICKACNENPNEILRLIAQFCIKLKSTAFLSEYDLKRFFNLMWQDNLCEDIYEVLIKTTETEKSELILGQLQLLQTFCSTLTHFHRFKPTETEFPSSNINFDASFLEFFKTHCPSFLDVLFLSLVKKAWEFKNLYRKINQRARNKETYPQLQTTIEVFAAQLQGPLKEAIEKKIDLWRRNIPQATKTNPEIRLIKTIIYLLDCIPHFFSEFFVEQGIDPTLFSKKQTLTLFFKDSSTTFLWLDTPRHIQKPTQKQVSQSGVKAITEGLTGHSSAFYTASPVPELSCTKEKPQAAPLSPQGNEGM